MLQVSKLLLCVFALLAAAAFANEEVDQKAEQLVVDQQERELLFFQNDELRNCVQREIIDFNDMFDAHGYRDMIFAEAGLTVNQLKKAKRWNKNTFQQTPEYIALMGAIEARKAELEEVGQIIFACQEETEGRNSALGAGARVGSFLAKAIDDGPFGPDALLAEFGHAPTPAPRPIFPIFVGVHSETDFLLQTSDSYFLGDTVNLCCGLTTNILLSLEFSIVVTVALGIPNSGQHLNSNMYGIDVGLGAHVGLMAGYYGFSNGVRNGPFLFEVTIGAGWSLPSIEKTVCRWGYDGEINYR